MKRIEDSVGSTWQRIVDRVKNARELGDLRENADYEAARNEQSFLEGRILDVEQRPVLHRPLQLSQVYRSQVHRPRDHGLWWAADCRRLPDCHRRRR